MIKKKITVMLALLAASFLCVDAAEPAGYYQSCEGLTGDALLKALNAKINPHTKRTYSQLWTDFKTTDVDENGLIWDMYSTKRWTHGSEQCGASGAGSTTVIGGCYNREHSFPKSWFGSKESDPMYTDLFHLYPTDGKVNSYRANTPLGECANGTTVNPANGYSAKGKLGPSTFSGYSGTVWEPDDEYKGDFARTYFYMAACYNTEIASWTQYKDTEMLAGNSYPAFSSWALNLLLKWHRQDPVSEKELNRCEAVYVIQKNRNPFIDHPELVEYVWGNKTGTAWYVDAASSDPEITFPIYGSTTTLGTASVGHARQFDELVRAANLSAPISASIAGAGFSLASSSIAAADATNVAGATLTILCNPTSAGTKTATLTLTSGAATCVAYFTVDAVEGLPALAAANVSDESFVARWVNVDAASATYQLHVKHDGAYLPGYPISVAAADEAYTVTGLEPSTTYTYYVTSPSLSSQTVSVITLAPIPYIGLMANGATDFITDSGTRSDVLEMTLTTENVTDNVAVAVVSPFRVCKDYSVSTNSGTWASAVLLSPEETTFYVCLDGSIVADGSYSTVVVATANGATNDDLELHGVVGTPHAAFAESFEAAANQANFSTMSVTGDATAWQLTNARIWSGTDKAKSGSKSLNLKYADGGSEGYMAADKTGGAGVLSFYARNWGASSDGKSKVCVSYSIDGGDTWTAVTTFELNRTDHSTYSLRTVAINQPGNVRVKFAATEGSGRALIDDISITDYTPAAVSSISLTSDAPLQFAVRRAEVSAPVAVELTTANIADELTVSVAEPFEITLDPAAGWSRSFNAEPGTTNFYIRFNATRAAAGQHSSAITVNAGIAFSNSSTVAAATVASEPAISFVEDFEANTCGTYTRAEVVGTQCTWLLSAAGVFTEDQAYEGLRQMKFNNVTTAEISTAEPKTNGAGTVGFYAKMWRASSGPDPKSTLKVMWSADGAEWTEAGTVEVPSVDAYAFYSVDINQTGDVYIKLAHTSGGRTCIDNLTISDCVRQPEPEVILEPKSPLAFEAEQGEATQAVAVDMLTADITAPLTVSVDAPFEVASAAEGPWQTSISVEPGESTFFVRLNAQTSAAGNYTGYITVTSGAFADATTEIAGRVTAPVVPSKPFFEDFEKKSNSAYNASEIEGTMCTWALSASGIFADEGNPYEGRNYMRMNTTSGAYFQTKTPKANGIGTISFYAKPWLNNSNSTLDTQSVVKISYSVDGTTWTDVPNGSFTIPSVNEYVEYSAPVNLEGSFYVRFTHVSGKRTCIDNLSITDYEAAPTYALSLSHDEGEIYFSCQENTVSTLAGVTIDTEVPGEIIVSVDSPFEVSAVYDPKTKAAEWTGCAILPAGTKMFYVHLDGSQGAVGSYTSQVSALADNAEAAYITVKGQIYDSSVTPGQAFVEDFEANKAEKYYDDKNAKTPHYVEGTRYSWEFCGAGIYSADVAHSNNHCVRFDETASSYIAMTQDKHNGVGMVSFYARPWKESESGAIIHVQYSTDGGATWLPSLDAPAAAPARVGARVVALSDATHVIDYNEGEYQLYQTTIEQPGDVRVRIQQSAGKRLYLDDVTLTNHLPSTEVVAPEAPSTWSAYARGGQLILDTNVAGTLAAVYSLDGVCRFEAPLAAGQTALDVEPGLYMVVVGDTARRVLVK